MLRDRLQLDSCLIRVEPQLALAFEHIRPPHNLISHLGLDVDFSEDGLVIAGTYLPAQFLQLPHDTPMGSHLLEHRPSTVAEQCQCCWNLLG